MHREICVGGCRYICTCTCYMYACRSVFSRSDHRQIRLYRGAHVCSFTPKHKLVHSFTGSPHLIISKPIVSIGPGFRYTTQDSGIQCSHSHTRSHIKASHAQTYPVPGLLILIECCHQPFDKTRLKQGRVGLGEVYVL